MNLDNSELLCKIRFIDWTVRELAQRVRSIILVRYLIMEYYQLFIYLYTILSSVAGVL